MSDPQPIEKNLVELANTFPGVRQAKPSWNYNGRKMPRLLDFMPLRNRFARARSRSRKRSAVGKRLADRPKNRKLLLQPNALN